MKISVGGLQLSEADVKGDRGKAVLNSRGTVATTTAALRFSPHSLNLNVYILGTLRMPPAACKWSSRMHCYRVIPYSTCFNMLLLLQQHSTAYSIAKALVNEGARILFKELLN